MTWYYVVAIVVSILVGATGIIGVVIKAVWVLSGMFGDLKASIIEIKGDLKSNIIEVKAGQIETQKDVNVLTSKIEAMQLMQNSLQARTIRLEEKVDKLGQ